MLFTNILFLFTLLSFVSSQTSETNKNTKSCGQNCQFSITQNILTIDGSGPMKNFYSDDEIPWKLNRNSITQIKINGISVISQKSFQNLPNVKTIDFGDTIEIEKGAFYNTGIESLVISKKIQRIDKNAFEQSLQLKSVTLLTLTVDMKILPGIYGLWERT